MKTLLVRLVHPNAVLPQRATAGSAGYDLSAAIDAPVRVEHGQVTKIPTGVAIQLDTDSAALLLGRSGLGIKHGVVPANAVGLIDSDFRGEIVVGLTCQCADGYTVQPNERIAQLVVVPICTPTPVLSQALDDTPRGSAGFGSTGA